MRGERRGPSIEPWGTLLNKGQFKWLKRDDNRLNSVLYCAVLDEGRAVCLGVKPQKLLVRTLHTLERLRNNNTLPWPYHSASVHILLSSP